MGLGHSNAEEIAWHGEADNLAPPIRQKFRQAQGAGGQVADIDRVRPCSNTVALAGMEIVRPIFSSASNSSGSRELQTLWLRISQSPQSSPDPCAGLCEQAKLRTLASKRPKTVSTKVFSAKLSKTHSCCGRSDGPVIDRKAFVHITQAEAEKVFDPHQRQDGKPLAS